MSDGTSTTNAGSLSAEELLARAKLGRDVVYFALAATALLGTVALVVVWLAPDSTRFAQVKDILTIVLPLIGTWVGTVLAFYFSRENFAAAATHTANLVRQLTPDQKLQSIPVDQVMLDMNAAGTTRLELTAAKPATSYKLQADIVDAILQPSGRNRLPIVEAGVVKHVLHRSVIDRFLVEQATAGAALANLTLDALLADAKVKPVIQSFATVGRDARLIAVKQAMDGNPDCADAFITEDGTKATRAIGWITNVMVREKSVA